MIAVRTVILPAGRDDLLAIGDYIAADNHERAASFVNEIIAVIAGIAEGPKRFPLRDDLRPGLRVARQRNYLIFLPRSVTKSRSPGCCMARAI